MVSVFFVRGSFDPEDVMLSEGQGVGIFPMEDLYILSVTPFCRRAIAEHLVHRLADDEPVRSQGGSA